MGDAGQARAIWDAARTLLSKYGEWRRDGNGRPKLMSVTEGPFRVDLHSPFESTANPSPVLLQEMFKSGALSDAPALSRLDILFEARRVMRLVWREHEESSDPQTVLSFVNSDPGGWEAQFLGLGEKHKS